MSSRYLTRPSRIQPHGIPELVLLIGEVPDDEAADQDTVAQHRAHEHGGLVRPCGEFGRVVMGDGLRICAARVARAMYSVRSKRSIAHKGEIDPNKYDLQFLLSATQWALAELVRIVGTSSMADAGRLVAQIQAPVGGLVEDFGDKQLVLRDMTVREEILVLAHHHYSLLSSLVKVQNDA